MKTCKALSAILSAALLLGTLAGCSTRGQSSAADTSSSAQSAAPEKTYTITLTSPVNGPVDDNSELQQYLNTLVPGLEVKIDAIEIGSYWDILNPRLAAEEIPDAFHCHNESMYTSYLTQGVLAGVDPQLIKDNMPKFVKGTESYGAEVWSIVLSEGKVYGLPAMDEAQTRPFTNAWRADWLKAVGIDKIPETVQEYEDALTKFTFNDPDGNGQNDTYGTTMRGKDATPNLFSSLFGAYGIYPNMWNMTEDGTLKFGITDPRAKEALAKLHSWYEKGIIDPEFTSVDGTVRTEKWANGKIGMMSDSTYYEVNKGNAAYENLMALNPKAEIARGPAPKGPNGDYGYINWSKLTNKIVFGKTIQNEDGKLKKFLQLWEMVNTDPDVYNRVKFGIENENWKRQEDGAIANIAPYNDVANRGKLGINAFDQGCLVPIPSVKAQALANNLEEQYKYAIQGTMENGKNYFSYLGKFVSGDVNTAYNAEADIIYKKNLIDFITGARSMDEYDSFVKEWNAAGGDAYTKAYNETYKTVNATMDEAKKIFS